MAPNVFREQPVVYRLKTVGAEGRGALPYQHPKK
jgi:hypothetical protein